MENIQEFFSGPVGQLIINAVGALLILLIGAIIAGIIARIVRGILKRINLDNRIANALTEPGKEQKWPVEEIAFKLTFWIIMLFVIVAALDQLNLTAISEPLGNLLDQVTNIFIPRLIAAGILTFVAWLTASILRFLTRKILHLIKLDERMAKVGAVEEDSTSATEALATAVYWFIILLFLPSILMALGLSSIALMITGVFDVIISWIPFLLMAALIVVVGWIAALVARQLTISILKAFGTDKLGEKAGIGEKRSLSEIIGYLVYYVILVVVAIAALDALQINAISEPLTAMLTDIIAFIPGLIGAVVILIVAYFVGRMVANLVRDLLANVGFDTLPEKLGLKWSTSNTPSSWAGSLTLIVILLFAATYAAEVMGATFLVVAMGQFIGFLWKVFLAGIFFAFGLYFANLAYRVIYSTGMNQANLLARLAQVAVIAFAGAIALQTLDVANAIITLAFGITMGAAGLAAALAFGLGSRDIAGREVDNFITAWRTPVEDSELPQITQDSEDAPAE